MHENLALNMNVYGKGVAAYENYLTRKLTTQSIFNAKISRFAVYRIRSIRRRGYYLFHRTILRGYYSRTATIRERRLLLIRRQTTTLGTSEVEEASPFMDIDDDEHEVDVTN